MGDFRIKIEAVGGHGCDRKAKEGEKLQPCGQAYCPDCNSLEFVELLKSKGFNVKFAQFTHWPSDLEGPEPRTQYPAAGEVKDDLLSQTRVKGSFS